MIYLKPIPQVADENAPFYAGLKQHTFLVPQCQSCGYYNWTPYPACRNCLSTDQNWQPVPDRGSLYTFTEIHKGSKAFSEDGPYIEAFMKIEQGPRPILVHGNLVGVPHNEIKLDMPLKISYFEPAGYDITLFQFEADHG